MTQNAKYSSVLTHLFFFVLAVLLLFYYDYFTLLTSPPVGTHIWRQTDSLSFAWTYWKNGLDFFHPQLLNRSFGDGYAVSEFPILQYLIAILYSIFGFHWAISKMVYTLVFFSGLIAVFRMAKYFIKNLFWAFFFPMLFFTAPAFLFYGTSCIPDVAALSFSFIGVSVYLDFKNSNKKIHLWLSMFFFCLAGLMKLTYLILFFASFAAVFIVSIQNSKDKKIPFARFLIPLLSVIVVNIIWYIWSNHYNAVNEHIYFLNKINPVWYESNEKAYILKRTLTEWALRFFAAQTNYFFLFTLLFLPFSYKKGNKFLFLTSFFLLIACISYYLLWYLQFLVHDYYTILFYSLYLFLFLNFFTYIKKNYPVFLNSSVLRIAAILLLATNAIHVKKDLQVRYEEANLYPADKYLLDNGLVPYIRSIGIKETDYVIVSTDGSPQIILCALQTPGFTEFHTGRYTAESITELKKKGAKYFISIEKDAYSEIGSEFGKLIGQYKEVTIYKL
jgi:hypothetical protein